MILDGRPAADARPQSSLARTMAMLPAIAFALGAAVATLACAGDGVPPPPPTRQEPVIDVVHGTELVDPYRWLEDGSDPEVREWIDRQNAYTERLLGDRPGLAEIEARLRELRTYDAVSTPRVRDGVYFFTRRAADQDLGVICRRRGLDGDVEVLVDPHPMSPDHTTSVDLLDVSEDGSLLLYAVRTGGTDEVEVRLLDVESGEDLPDALPDGLYGGFAFAPDGSGFYYTARTREAGGSVRFHRIGRPAADDGELFGGLGPSVWLSATPSPDGRWLLLSAQHGWARNDLYLVELEAPGRPAPGAGARPLVVGESAHFRARFADDRLVLYTDLEAPRGRVLVAPLDDLATSGTPGEAGATENAAQRGTSGGVPADAAGPPLEGPLSAWEEIVPEADDVLEGVTLAGGRLYLLYLHDVASRVGVFELDGTPTGELEVPPHHSASLSGRWESDELSLSAESFTRPRTTWRIDLTGGERDVWSRQDVPFDGSAYETSQHWYTSADGTEVPLFLVQSADAEADGARPTLLYGYGGFNVAQRPRFDPMWAVWLERGGVFALANIRGGSEFGEEWHRAGMLENKQNVFDDFIAAAEWLIEAGVTGPERLAVQGGSNGGLLVGAVLTQRPGLFRAVLCEFPDLDMIRYPHWTDSNNPPALLEYGDSREPEHFEFLIRYSPYQNVREGTAYPAVLLTSGDADTRVPPQQARKMAARLQQATTSGQPVLLRYDTKAGHAGGRPLAKLVEDEARELAFLAWQLGMEVEDAPDG